MNAARTGHRLIPLLCALLAACGGGADDAAEPRATAQSATRGDGEQPDVVVADPAAACEALAGTAIAAAAIGLPTQGAMVQTAALTPAAGNDPEYCRVRGQVRSVDAGAPAINFQLNLPTTWARRSMQLGGGGFNGSVVTGTGNVPGTTGANAPRTPLQRQFATFGSDSGSSVPAGASPAAFGMNAEAFANYSGDGVKKTRDAAQFLIRAYYGQSPRHQYYAGGSKGGHEGLVAAQRYGDDYDGVIAYYPANQHLFLIYGWEGIRRAVTQPGGALNAAKQTLVLNALNQACDALDGLADGVIADRAACNASFDVASLQCPGGGDDGNQCLSSAQVNTLRVAASTTTLPYPQSNGTTTAGPFPATLGGNLVSTLGSYNFFNLGVIRYWYLKDPVAPDAAISNFDFLANRSTVETVLRQYDAVDPNIDRFVSGGGKLILVQGTTDMLVPPAATDQYYEALAARYRGRIQNTVRYYVQPGYGHGSGVFGMAYDSLSALDAWVTKGAAPSHQVAFDGNAATAGRSMPLCEYPAFPRYAGSGDPTLASSFACVGSTSR